MDDLDSYWERDIACTIWSRTFDEWEVKVYWGIATLFGEKEQCMYPDRFSYSIWKNNFRNVLIEAVGLDVFCVDFIMENYFTYYFNFC